MKITFEREHIIKLLVLSVVTLGVYIPFWYKRQYPAIEGLKVEKKLTKNFIDKFVILGIISGVITLLSILGGNEASTAGIDAVDRVFSRVFMIINIVAVFKLGISCNKAEYFEAFGEKPLNYVALFFFGIFYFQYRINNLTAQISDNISEVEPEVIDVVLEE